MSIKTKVKEAVQKYIGDQLAKLPPKVLKALKYVVLFGAVTYFGLGGIPPELLALIDLAPLAE